MEHDSPTMGISWASPFLLICEEEGEPCLSHVFLFLYVRKRENHVSLIFPSSFSLSGSLFYFFSLLSSDDFLNPIEGLGLFVNSRLTLSRDPRSVLQATILLVGLHPSFC